MNPKSRIVRFVVLSTALLALAAAYAMDRSHPRAESAPTVQY